jgi:hypothetical protein
MHATIPSRVDQLDWADLESSLSRFGYARTPPILTAAECRGLIDLYAEDRLFRSRVEMARFRFGEGDYKYFAHPLPDAVGQLRESLYPRLAPIANRWWKELGEKTTFPDTLTEAADAVDAAIRGR